jgi:hypothetical protein
MNMKSKGIIGLVIAFILPLILAVVSCTNPGTPTTPTLKSTQVPYQQKVEDLIKNSSTFKFDGIAESIKFINIISSTEGTSTEPAKDWEFTVEYQTNHPGHGDRTGPVLAQVVTDHKAVFKVNNGEITSAVCDNVWDMLADKDMSE